MIYLTRKEGYTSGMLINARSHIFPKLLSAVGYGKYNYIPLNPASDHGQGASVCFSLLLKPFLTLRIVHNLCINWQ